MNPLVMLMLVVGAHAAFLWSVSRRFQLMQMGVHKVGTGSSRLDAAAT